MNIVYVSREFGPITGGGIGTYISNACRAMLDRGHRVFFVTDCVNPQNQASLPTGLHWIPTESLPQSEKGGCFSYNHEYSHRVYRTLQTLCARESIDVIEFAEYCGEGFVSIRAKRVLGAFSSQLLVVKCHTPLSLLEVINEDREFAAWVECDIEMEDYCVSHADRVTSPSRSLADYFQKRTGREGIAICPYPLYLDFDDNPLPIRERKLKTVRFFGSVQVRKGVDTFIDAAVRILERDPGFRFEIIGKERNAHFFNRTYTDVLKNRIPEGYEDRIVFEGGIPYQEVGALLGSSSFIVLPSRWENWANACLESMSKGCVVMASASGGMAEMIEHGINGFVIDPHDAEALASLILELGQGSHDLQAISRAAVNRARELTDPEQTARHMEKNYAADFGSQFASSRKPLVSVVVPFYNQSTTLQETLDSIRASDYPEVEIVVVNDGSTSPAARRCFEALEGVIKVDQKNGGLSAARNAGIRASSGEYFLPLDSDDLLHPEYISKAVTALENCGELGYVTCYTRNFGALNSPYYPLGFVNRLMPFLNTSGKCTNLYRREVFDRVGGYDECMNSYEDWDFLLSLADAGVKGDVLPEELFFYRRSYASMVFSVANPIRANLIQYMMLKHRKAWAEHGERVALLLLRLWKEAEMREEAHQFEEFRIYWGGDEGLCEKNARAMSYKKEGQVCLECTIPYDPSIHTLRFDFAVSEMRIELNRIEVFDLLKGKAPKRFDREFGWQGIEVAGTAELEGTTENGNLLIRSFGNDPQILLSDPGLSGAELHVCFDFTILTP